MESTKLTQEKLKKIFYYRNDGNLIRRSDKKIMGCKTSKTHRYKRITIENKVYALHRCIFLYHHGYLPEVIDHIDNNRENNRIENLREATQQQNCLNRKHHSNSASPYKNVYWSKAANKWVVNLSVYGKRIHFGVFEHIELADLVAIEARNKYHGDFANHGG